MIKSKWLDELIYDQVKTWFIVLQNNIILIFLKNYVILIGLK
jgi:hypothetical protein